MQNYAKILKLLQFVTEVNSQRLAAMRIYINIYWNNAVDMKSYARMWEYSDKYHWNNVVGNSSRKFGTCDYWPGLSVVNYDKYHYETTDSIYFNYNKHHWNNLVWNSSVRSGTCDCYPCCFIAMYKNAISTMWNNDINLFFLHYILKAVVIVRRKILYV